MLPMNVAGGRLAGGVSAHILRGLVGDSSFTIVSNNCWGAHIYRALGVGYATPFVGLFITPKCYLTLLENFDLLMLTDLVFTNHSHLVSLNAWRKREDLSYSIGILGGEVEINFQHYSLEKDARAKWRRRCRRMTNNPARRFFKFDDREGARSADIIKFGRLPLDNKVCFTARPHESGSILAPAEAGTDHVIDGLALGEVSGHYFNALRWLSTWPRWVALPSLL